MEGLSRVITKEAGSVRMSSRTMAYGLIRINIVYARRHVRSIIIFCLPYSVSSLSEEMDGVSRFPWCLLDVSLSGGDICVASLTASFEYSIHVSLRLFLESYGSPHLVLNIGGAHGHDGT